MILAPEGIDGTLVTEEKGSGEIVDETCPETNTFPPADGPMATDWANCGFYERPVSPPHAVHSLYNGAVWIAYDPRLDSRSLEIVRATATRASHVLASPQDGLDTPLVLSAWQRQLQLDDVDDPRFDEFISAYLYTPQRPEIYAPCRDGQGEPTESFWDGADH